MVTFPDGNGLILIGGQHINLSPWNWNITAKILQLRRDCLASSWTTMKQKLKYARSRHVAIPIPHKFTMCST